MESDEYTLLSIAIPTRNRQSYLTCLIKELLTSDRQDFEIVIQDNSDNDSLRELVHLLADSRLHYNYTAGWISVVENCDNAIAACHGHYVCMLGDDDGIILDEALKVLAMARQERADAVMSEVLLYVWPDLDHHLVSNYGGKLYITPIKGKTQSNDLVKIASRVITRGGALGLQDLPCVYHGFVSSAALSALKARTGSFFPGPSPDMANAIGLCSVLKSFVRTPRPLVITGHSVRSTAGAGTQRKHHGGVKDQPHLPSDTVASWFPEIPFFWSGPTIYAQSLYSALRRTGNNAFGSPGSACVYAACLMYHREYSREIFKSIGATGELKIKLYSMVVYYLLEITIKRGYNFINTLRNRFDQTANRHIAAANIAEAMRAAKRLHEV